MQDQGTETLKKDIQNLISDARVLFSDASEVGSQNAEELRRKGASMLHKAVDGLIALEQNALRAGRSVATETNQYVHEKPWVAVGVSAGIGVLVGLLISKRS